MERNSTTLFLESPGPSVTPVPWNNGSPILDGFSEPTRSALEGAWSGFIASGQQLEVIPDPEPTIPVVQPDWQGWQLVMSADSAWQAVEATPNNYVSVNLGKLYVLVSQVAKQPETVLQIQAVWAGIVDALGISREQRNSWRVIAQAHNLPQSFIQVI